MAMFRYHRHSKKPNPVFEGDRMKQEGEFVEILRYPRNGETATARVAIIHLEAGEFVEELK
ncbi:MAG: hypothetical protein ACYCO5_06795 [Acidobacteriaceae bacterium]